MSAAPDFSIESLRLENRTLLDLAREAARHDNPYADAAMAEITRRTAQAQIDTAIAQADAANWMRWSVIILGMVAFAGALFQALSWLWPNPLHLH